MKTVKCKNCKRFVKHNPKNPNKIFCNGSCAATYNNKGTAKSLIHGRYAKKKCAQCGVNTNSPRFCSNKCQFQWQYEYISEWLLGNKTGGNGIAVSNHVRRWLKETRGYRCENCGWAETNKFSKSIPIEIDHIDGNSKNTRPENTRLLCPNCHSLTSTHGSLNRGKGRRYTYVRVPRP
jgi:hypothetical protein